jgi:hypothetical protein
MINQSLIVILEYLSLRKNTTKLKNILNSILINWKTNKSHFYKCLKNYKIKKKWHLKNLNSKNIIYLHSLYILELLMVVITLSSSIINNNTNGENIMIVLLLKYHNNKYKIYLQVKTTKILMYVAYSTN